MHEKQPKLPPIKDCFGNVAFVECALTAAWGAWRNDFNLPLGRLVVVCLADSAVKLVASVTAPTLESLEGTRLMMEGLQAESRDILSALSEVDSRIFGHRRTQTYPNFTSSFAPACRAYPRF